ncbi:rhomboid family intramembrane serine protease [Microbacterium aureliae]
MTTDDFRSNRENFCYRHPDRQSFVLCQRCLRTICPECQTPAAVGVICPECLQNQQKSRSTAQRKAERRWSRPRVLSADAGRPMVTYAIIALTAFAFLVGLVPGAGSVVREYLLYWAPYLYPDLTGSFQVWRLVTVALVHDGFWHLGLNMLALWLLGRSLEPLLGRWRFLTLYLVGCLGGSVAVTLLSFTTPVVGASGAIFALFGALLVIGRHLGANITGIAIILGINLVIGFIPGFNISWQAHLGGLIAGAAVGFIYARTRSVRRQRMQIPLLAVLIVVLLGLMLLPPAYVY